MASTNTPKQNPRKSRSSFVRTRVPLGERIAGVTIVSLLVAIGAIIGIKGRHFDPNLYSLRTDALKTTAAMVEGKQGTLKENSSSAQDGSPNLSDATKPSAAVTSAAPTAAGAASGEEGDASAPSPSLPAGAAGEPLEIVISGLKPMGATEFYSPDNLFEKIDGRAPAYLAFNFQQLRNRSFSVEGTAGSYVDVYEFRMDTPINAFGAFAMERDPNGNRLNFAPDGYAGAMGFYFRQGSVYVQVIASDQNARTMEAAKSVAELRAKAIPSDNQGLDARRKLPADGLEASSVTFIQENAQGQEFLKNVFQAVYQFEGKQLPFFIMSTTPTEAAGAWNSFQSFCGKYGGKTTPLPDVNGAKVFKAENFGTWKIVFQREGDIGGVFDASDPDKAQKFIEQYLKGEIH